jgi:hypothetical protein
MPLADLAMQRKVPTRLIWMIMLKASSGKCRASPVALSRLAVLMALPVPAQLTRIRSWPWAARAFSNPASTSSSDVTLTLQNTPPIALATSSPLASFMSKMATLTPWAAKARAVASPRPEAPPVTTAATVLSSFMDVSSEPALIGSQGAV